MIATLLFCESRYPVNRRAIKKTVEAVLGERGVSGNVEVSVSIVGDRKMRILNKKYREKDTSTDVLSFSQLEGKPADKVDIPMGLPDKVLRLGDVIVSYPMARKNAAKKEVLVEEEIHFLIRHGLHHLLGIHHE